MDGLKFADGFAESVALLGVLDRFVERALRQADGLRGDSDAAAVERAERDLEPLPFFAQAIFGWHFAIVQNNFD